jgi:hypothetical protein
MRRLAATAAVVCLTVLGGWASPARPSDPTPLLAYYYVWFDPTSWDRAKRDYPLLGRYSSDEKRVMVRHVRWAKRAGIDGFIVSWKSTWRLNRRLEKLMSVAAAENFKLAIIYQGLNFERDPQPVERVAADLDFFIHRYAGHESFDIFARPLVIWSGTWRFSAADIAAVTSPRRDLLQILATEKSPADYERVRAHVDGDAYYWSSVDPQRYTRYWEKLVAMGDAVHAGGGLWIAPAAPGFDARLLGGTSVVPRRAGQTLRERLDGAVRSSPDAIGLISWNEFSENTHIEPSEKYGSRYLGVVADVRGATFRSLADLDSSDPAAAAPDATGLGYGAPLLLGTLALALAIAIAAARRRRRPNRSNPRRPNGGAPAGGPPHPDTR